MSERIHSNSKHIFNFSQLLSLFAITLIIFLMFILNFFFASQNPSSARELGQLDFDEWETYTDSYWAFTASYPSNWTLQKSPYRDFGLRISSPDIVVNELGDPVQGAFLSVFVKPMSPSEWETYHSQIQLLNQIDMVQKIIVKSGDGKQVTGLDINHNRFVENSFYNDGFFYKFHFVQAKDTPIYLSIGFNMLANIILEGTPKAHPLPDYDALGINLRNFNFPQLKIPFPNGPGFIASGGGYNNGSIHKSYDQFGLDFCVDSPSCKQKDGFVIAPTDVTYIHTASNQTDYHFFEIDNDGSNKLCMSLGHFSFNDTVIKGMHFRQGTILGPLSDYDPPHAHMGIFSVPISGNGQECLGSNRAAIPFTSTNGNFQLDGINYPECYPSPQNCFNVHANRPVTSTNDSVSRNNVSMVLIIDSTGSMRTNDPYDIRKDAAKAFIDAVQVGDKIAVVSFDTRAYILAPLREIQSPADKELLREAVDQVDSSGNTNINAGLNGGFNELLSDPNSAIPKAAILLTDGDQTYTSYDFQSHLQFKDHGWKVYTVGLKNSNQTLLEKIASESGGTCFNNCMALSVSNDLRSLYQLILSEVVGGQMIVNKNLMMSQGSTEKLLANVPRGQTSATFFIGWPGSEVNLTLISPSGRVINPNTTTFDVYHSKEQTYEIYNILFPESGLWSMELYGKELPIGGEEVDVRAFVRGLHNIYLPMTLNNYNSVSPPTPTATPTPTLINTPTNTPTPMDTPTPTVTSTPTITPTPFSCNSLPFNEVILFEHISCRGEYEQFLWPGFFNLQSSQFNDKASSINVPSGMSVKIYEHYNGEGQSRCFEQLDSDLRDDTWPDGSTINDTISSIEVFEDENCVIPTPVPYDCNSVPYDGILLFKHISCGGEYEQFLSPGFFNLTDLGFNDLTSSIHVPSGSSIRVYEHINRQGQNLCIESNNWNFRNSFWPDSTTMNDTISSVEVYYSSGCSP